MSVNNITGQQNIVKIYKNMYLSILEKSKYSSGIFSIRKISKYIAVLFQKYK